MLALLLACGSDPTTTTTTTTTTTVDTDPAPDTDPPTAPEDTGATGDTGTPELTGTTTDANGCVTDHDEPLDTDCPCWTELDAVLAGQGSTDTGLYQPPDWVSCNPPALLPAEDQVALDGAMSSVAPQGTPVTVDFGSREAFVLSSWCGSSRNFAWEHARACEADGRAVLDFSFDGLSADVPVWQWWVLDVPREDYGAIEVRSFVRP